MWFNTYQTEPDSRVVFLVVGPSLVAAVKKDWATQSTIALSWQEAEQPHAAILDYEIKYYEKVQNPGSERQLVS